MKAQSDITAVVNGCGPSSTSESCVVRVSLQSLPPLAKCASPPLGLGLDIPRDLLWPKGRGWLWAVIRSASRGLPCWLSPTRASAIT